MKAVFVSIGMVVAVAVAGSVYLVHARNQQTNIVKVFSENSKAAMGLQDELHGRRSLSQTQRDWKDFAQSLQAIDASSCPKDFRLAWFDYVSAVTDLSHKIQTANALKDAVELEMSVWMKDGKLAEPAMQDLDASNRMAECFRQCQRIAITYGVSFHPVVNQSEGHRTN